MQCIYNKPQGVQSLQSRPSYFLVFYHFGFETTTLTFSRIIDFDDATNLFFKRVYSCAVVDACLMWTDLIILISRPVRWDKLDQSTHFKGKLHKLPINVIIWLQIMSFSDWLTSLVTIFDSNKVNKWNYYTSHNKESIILVKYRILGILFMGLTLSRGISGEPERRLTWYTPW